MKATIRSSSAALVLMLAGSETLAAQVHPWVATDHEDYSPGSTVAISGTGFRPGEAVRLQILQAAANENDGVEHQPWDVRADLKGNFQAKWLVKAHESGATLRLAAKGLASRLSTETIFTDASVSPATGGGAIPAATAGASYTAPSGPALTETIVGDISLGTIVLTAPAGFEFDTNLPAPYITLSGDNNNKNINTLTNGAIIPLAVTTSTLSFTVTTKSKGQTKNTLAYSNIRVRPTAASPLASGNITNTGTSLFPNSTANFGTLTEVAGAITALGVTGFPTPQIAGTPGSITVTANDQFGNVIPGYTGTIHFSSSDPQAVLPADYTFVSADNGAHAFTGVILKTIGTQSLTASNMAPASFSGMQSGIVVSPAPADHLAFSVQPGSGVYGSLLNTQPVVVSQDVFGNNSTVGLGGSKLVTLALTSGSGSLVGTTTLDIGTGAGNGVANFTGLSINAAGSGDQLTASAAGLTNALSSTFSIAQAPVTPNVTVSNKVYDGTTSATIATRALLGVVGTDNVLLTGGIAAFATRSAGTAKTVTVSGLGLTGTAAPNYVLASPSTTTLADISPAPLTVTAVAIDKVYDGTTFASVTLSDNRVPGDSLTDSYTAAAFTDKNVGTAKPVNVTGLSLNGTDAGNYTANTSATAAAAITPATLTGIASDLARSYGQTNPPFTVSYSGFVSGEDAGLLTGTLSISTSAATNSPVGTYPISASGQSAANYSVHYVAGTLTVTAAPLWVAANDATRFYGDPNPSFSWAIGGFVNGEDTNALGGTLTLSTTAQTTSPPGNYPIVPSGWLATNYIITYSNGTLAVTTTNQAPVLAALTNAIVRPEQLLVVPVSATDPDGDALSFSLDAGAPAGAMLTNLVMSVWQAGSGMVLVTNTVFAWSPTRAQASSTNFITVTATDNGGPPMSASQTFTVVVLDYLEISLGSTNVQSGQSVAVPINVASSDGVTNLQFTLDWPANYFSNAALTATAPAVGSASLQDNTSNLVLTLQAAAGQALQGTQQLAQLSFVALSNQFSAFVPLPVLSPVAAKPDGSSYTNYITPTARVAVIEGEPLLWAWLSSGSTRELSLYGRLGQAYQLQSTTSLLAPISWAPEWDYVQTNGVINIQMDTSRPIVFYRIFQP